MRLSGAVLTACLAGQFACAQTGGQSTPSIAPFPGPEIVTIRGYSSEVSTLRDQIRSSLAELCQPASEPNTAAQSVQNEPNSFDASHCEITLEANRHGSPDQIVASSNLISSAQQKLNDWTASIESGQDIYPPLDDLSRAVDQMRADTARFAELTGEDRNLSAQIARLNAQLAQFRPESEEWLATRGQLQEASSKLQQVKSEWVSILDKSFPAPDPLKPSDRSSSPFQGKRTPGIPDRLWIWLQKPSILIGNSMEAQIGLGNRNGPNVLADKDYSINVNCQGCVLNDSKIVIKQNNSFAATRVRVTSRTPHLSAGASGIAGTTANPIGCPVAHPVTIQVDQPKNYGFAGESIAFSVLTVDKDGQPAADAKNRHPYNKAVSSGEATLDYDRHAGHQGTSDGSSVIPPDECGDVLLLTSQTVGEKVVSIAPLDHASPQNKSFRFHYHYPLIDLIAALVGAILGLVANLFILRSTKVRWYWSFVSSLIGGYIVFVVGVLKFLDQKPLLPTWPFAGLLGIAGGIIGVSAIKIVAAVLPISGLSSLLKVNPKSSDPTTSKGKQAPNTDQDSSTDPIKP